MNITVTTFTNPFSFFCITDYSKEHPDLYKSDDEVGQISRITEFNHGQYVAVMWKNKWVRGIVTMESQILIWLLDYGIFLRPNETIFCIDLPFDFKKLPTKVFEASIQGVLPTDKVLRWSMETTNEVQFKNDLTSIWTPGAIERANTLLEQSEKTYFNPIAVLSTPQNDVVLGDLFLKLPSKGIVNIKDELKKWPVFLEQNMKAYVQNLPKFYTSRRRHHSCLLKPNNQSFNIPTITFKTTIQEYTALIENMRTIDTIFSEPEFVDDCSTVVGKEKRDKCDFKIMPADIEKYATRFITLNGKQYNVLTILINKSRDLKMCEKYKDHDLKSIGRGISYRSKLF
ncbi:uncharacterized protein LOC120637098 [Pararge aegeria]|nr:uncharacterized protein LOC120637098 [Pararge aegeria]